jgi:hypothetical protein
MINPGYKISVKETEEMKEFKSSAAYGTYLKAISASPAFAAVMKEHIQNINILDDLKHLKNEGKLPDEISEKTLNELFKQSLIKMAIGIVADAVILKELEDTRVEEVVNGLKSDSDVIYLLGEADKTYYDQAARLNEKGKLDKDSIAFRGLMMFIKKHEKELSNVLIDHDRLLKKGSNISTNESKKHPNKKDSEMNAIAPDFDSNDITL